MPEPKVVGVYENERRTVVSWHIPGTSNYETLCGLDGDDPECGQHGTTVGRQGQKIDCPDCRSYWNLCKLYTINNFKKGA